MNAFLSETMIGRSSISTVMIWPIDGIGSARPVLAKRQEVRCG